MKIRQLCENSNAKDKDISTHASCKVEMEFFSKSVMPFKLSMQSLQAFSCWTFPEFGQMQEMTPVSERSEHWVTAVEIWKQESTQAVRAVEPSQYEHNGYIYCNQLPNSLLSPVILCDAARPNTVAIARMERADFMVGECKGRWILLSKDGGTDGWLVLDFTRCSCGRKYDGSRGKECSTRALRLTAGQRLRLGIDFLTTNTQ